MIIAYVAGRFRGKTDWEKEQHAFAAQQIAIEVAHLGAMPIVPQMNTRHFDHELTAEFWLEGTLEAMRRCDAVVLVSNWRESQGARGEVREALALSIPVFDDLDEFAKWMRGVAARTLGHDDIGVGIA